MRLRLATRGSALAWGQSQLIADALRAGGHDVELVKVVTRGDVSTAPLTAIGGAGVFVGAVRAAVLARDADFAVHSFKDLPTGETPGLVLAAVPLREDPADVLCGDAGLSLAQLPARARVGTGSARRSAQLLALRDDLDIVDIRGNVETRLRRAQEDLDAVVLASAGLRRLGLQDAVSERFEPLSFLPAPGQGALAVECRSDASNELKSALAALDDTSSRLSALAERAVLERLDAGCAAPVGAYARVEDDELRLTAAVTSLDGRRRLTEHGAALISTASTPAADLAAALGRELADRLLGAGAGDLADLAAAKRRPLTGRRVLLPDRWRESVGGLLIHAGAEVRTAKFTDIEPISLTALDAELARPEYDWLVVTSATTIPSLATAHGPTAFASMKIGAVGPATADALAAAGFEVDLVAEHPGGAGLADSFPPGPGRVLLPGAADPSPEPAAGLRAKGWSVTPVPVYRTVARRLPQTIVSEWRAGHFDAFVVTAGSIAQAGVAAAGLPGPPVIAIGEPSAAAAKAAGLVVAAVAAAPDAESLAAAVVQALTS